jgi:conjugative transfer region protein (TIGR03748 family)
MLSNAKDLKVVVLAGAILFSCTVAASQEERQLIGRYTTKETIKYETGLDSFEKVSEMVFHENISTIGGAITLVIRDSGYSLLPTESSERAVSNMLSLRLPKDHRALGAMSRKDILRTLVGPGFVLVVDPVSRKLTFKLRESYALL